MYTLFIHTNRKQSFGARLGKYSFETGAGPGRNFKVEFIVAEELPELQDFVGKTFLSSEGDLRTYTFDDLQSFTLARFKPPELMGYRERAIVIDPDIFALPGTRLDDLFEFELEDADLGCVFRVNGRPENSLMLLDCERLASWNLRDFLKQLEKKKLTKQELMAFPHGEKIKALPPEWNSLDRVDGAKVLHATRRLTQPWKTGLPIDFTLRPMPKLFGFIPREPLHKLLGRYPTRYLEHPDAAVNSFFFSLAKRALVDGAISTEDIRHEMTLGNIRPDFLDVLSSY